MAIHFFDALSIELRFWWNKAPSKLGNFKTFIYIIYLASWPKSLKETISVKNNFYLKTIYFFDYFIDHNTWNFHFKINSSSVYARLSCRLCWKLRKLRKLRYFKGFDNLFKLNFFLKLNFDVKYVFFLLLLKKQIQILILIFLNLNVVFYIYFQTK